MCVAGTFQFRNGSQRWQSLCNTAVGCFRHDRSYLRYLPPCTSPRQRRGPLGGAPGVGVMSLYDAFKTKHYFLSAQQKSASL